MPNSKKHPGGRPSAYQEEYAELAYNYCLLGATDAQLGEFFKVSARTINTWKKQHPEFAQALLDGKTAADAKVANSLFNRATGFSHPETKVNVYEGEVIKTEITKHYAPDTTACIFWMKNRQPDKWRDKVEVEDTSLKADPEMMERLAIEFEDRMKKARERQRLVLIERGIIEN
ncbi:hypothetical protein [Methylomonas methanica]|uniref:Terminase n=1 Tax=Methylomonas methanica (strain DSM 25384 / MC09) TaxID=857087 RepID=G0A3T0_METMM|nr:hypothetical protein [Methylomonas methanica]AEG02702.1 hypothetical protein Metme_4354 [Methylomonas methanica MC09]